MSGAVTRRGVKVSVVMACYNCAPYLEEAAASVLAQTLGDLELILVDDCSTDGTLEIARGLEARDGRVSVLSLPVNSRQAVARNAGIHVARGEWIGILDSDDVAAPSRFEEQMALADREGDLVMIGSSSVSMDGGGRRIKGHSYPTRHEELVRRLRSSRGFPPHSSMVYRRAALTGPAVFNPRFVPSEDCDLWLRLSESGKIASVDKPLVRIRKHGGGISNLEGGDMQVRLGRAAIACHFLRGAGFPDPSTGDDEAAWREFLGWFDRRMTEDGFYDRIRAWAHARAGFFASGNRVAGAFRMGARLLASRSAVTMLRENLLGFGLPERLAREWMTRRHAPRD